MRVLPSLFLATAVFAGACTLDPEAADDFGFGDETGVDDGGAATEGADDDGVDDGVDDGGESGDESGGDDGVEPADVPHAHGTIVLGEVHAAGGVGGQSTPIVSASFIPDSEAQASTCATDVMGCSVVTVPDCAGLCAADQVCGFDAACTPTCQTICSLACAAGEECYFPVPGSPACRKAETFDAGALSFSGTTVPVTLFPPYEFVGDVTGALTLPGQEITVAASGATAAGFAAFERTFTATELLVSFIDQITMEQAYGPAALPVRWQPGQHEVRVTVTVTGVSGTYGVVTCDADDSGMFDVPRAAIAAAVPQDEPSGIHVDITRRAVAMHKDVATTGALVGATVRSEAWLELVSSSSESTTIEGCGGLAFCSSACVDTLSDEANCGGCDAPCAVGEVCSVGECTATGGGDAGSCCATSGSPGCSNAAVQACVCASDSYCCSTAWDSACVGEVTSLGCGVC